MPDGRSQISIVWIGLDGDEIVAGHLPSIGRSATSVVIQEWPYLLQRLDRVYLGADVKFPPMSNPPPGYITHITVERLGGVGPWAGDSGVR